MQRLPATLELTLASLLLAIVIGIPLGVLSAVHRDTFIDHVGRVVGVAGVAMPTLLDRAAFRLRVLLSARTWRRRRSAASAPASRRRTPHHRALRRRLPADAAIGGRCGSSLHQLVLPALTLGLQRHGAGRPHGALDHAGNPGVRLHHGRLGGRVAAPHGDLRRRAAQRDDPGHHHARHRVRIPDGRQCRGRDACSPGRASATTRSPR